MSNPSFQRRSDEDIGTPRWVKVFGIVVLILVLIFVTLHLAGRGLGNHGSADSDTAELGMVADGRLFLWL